MGALRFCDELDPLPKNNDFKNDLRPVDEVPLTGGGFTKKDEIATDYIKQGSNEPHIVNNGNRKTITEVVYQTNDPPPPLTSIFHFEHLIPKR